MDQLMAEIKVELTVGLMVEQLEVPPMALLLVV
jgi:hypothetical protein